MPKPHQPQIVHLPPSGNNVSNANAYSSPSTSVSSNSAASQSSYLVADLRREQSSNSFTPATVISGPIPPLPKRNHHQPGRDSPASLREREYSGSGRRAPSREPSGGSLNSNSSGFSPYTVNLTSSGGLSSPNQNGISHYNHHDTFTPHSPPLSLTSSISPSSTSRMSTQSTSTAATHNTPRGSVSSARSHEISSPMIQHFSNSGSSVVRSSLYSTIDDHNSHSSNRSGKTAMEFHLERPTDDKIIEQMFNDLIVSFIQCMVFYYLFSF